MASIAYVIDRWVEHNEGVRPTRSRLTASSVYFDGPVIYSYRMPLARYYGNMVLLQAGKLRPTNSKHMGWIRFKPTRPVFFVPDIHAHSTANLLYLLTQLDNAKRLYELRYLKREDWEVHRMSSEIGFRHMECVDYSRLSGIDAPDVPDLDALFEEAQVKRNERWAKYSSPGEVRKRERAAARKEARLALFQDGELI